MKTGDVIGHEFGNWLVVGPCSDHIRVWCKCKCGTIRPVIPYNLVYGKSHSCGCEKKKSKKNEEKSLRNAFSIKDAFMDMAKCGDITGIKYPDCECCKHILLEDMLGVSFGMLTVIGDSETKYHVKCSCACGNVVDIAKYNLLYGKKKSCGCVPDESFRKQPECHSKPNVGDWFAKLTVLEFIPTLTGTAKQDMVRCLCDCGNEVVIRWSNLYQDVTKSCGCLINRSGRKNIFFSNGEQKWVATFWDKEAKRQIRVARNKDRQIVEQKYDSFLLARGLSA